MRTSRTSPDIPSPGEGQEMHLDQKATCEECGKGGLDGLDDIQVGGDGTWEDRLQCLRCFHYWKVSHSEVIIPLMMRKYGCSRAAAEECEEMRRERYQRELAQSRHG